MLVENWTSEAPSTSAVLRAVITGFAPFKIPPQPNPSSALLPLLPTHIPATPTHPFVQVKTLPPVRVSYDDVLALVPRLARYYDYPCSSSSISHETPPSFSLSSSGENEDEEGGEGEGKEEEEEEEPDIVIHIGMSTPKAAYRLETLAHRDEYVKPDVDRKVLPAGVVDEWVREERPEFLDVRLRKSRAEDVWRRWKSALLADTGKGKGKRKGKRDSEKEEDEDDDDDDNDDDVKVILSSDAGRYLCEFVLYASLGFWWARRKRRREKGTGKDSRQTKKGDEDGPVVVFLHVPSDCKRRDLEKSARVVVALVKALAESCFGKTL